MEAAKLTWVYSSDWCCLRRELLPIACLIDSTSEQKGVEKLLHDLNTNRAAKLGRIPAKILCECAFSLSPMPIKIFQKSFDSSCFPEDYLDKNITSLIYRKGDRCNPRNYRPVSLTLIPCKILQHIL